MTRAADWLGLAAAPTFGGMAFVSAYGDAPALCGLEPGHPLAGLTGMSTMYLLMAVFHASPWVRRIARPGRDDPRGG